MTVESATCIGCLPTAGIAGMSASSRLAPGMMEVMFRHRRGANAAAPVVALLGMVAGAFVGWGLSRWFRRLASSDTVEPSRPSVQLAESSPLIAGESPLSTDDASDHPKSSRARRILAWIRHGVTPTVCLLWVLGIAIGVWAYRLRPESALPQPGRATLYLIFEPRHFADAPIGINLQIDKEGSSGAGIGIYIQGRDLKQPGWKLLAYVPHGVHPPGPYETLALGRITQRDASGDVVDIAPGPLPKGEYGTFLAWNNLSSGLMQTRNANLVARFPAIVVENDTSEEPPNASTPPNPQVTLSRVLHPGSSDYAYLGGPPPDRVGFSTWSWNQVSGKSGSGITSFASMTIDARSAVKDEKSHSAEFQSGVLFGVAAAALIAGLQAFMNTNRKEKKEKHGRKTDAGDSAIVTRVMRGDLDRQSHAEVDAQT